MSVVLEIAATGVAAGFLAGMFGVGGGILMVPAMVLLLGFSQLDAQATSLAAMLPALGAGALRQRHFGNVRARAAVTVGACSLAGVGFGTVLATSLPEPVLRVLFSILLVVVAFRLLWEVRGRRRAPLAQEAPGLPNLPVPEGPAPDRVGSGL
jgi:uncharacterized membrane protein YfcA